MPEHVVARHAVLDAADAAGVGGDIAADRRDPVARGVGRIPEAVGGDRLPEVVVDDPGLGDDVPLCDVELEHARHALERDDDRLRERVRAAREAGAGAARDDASVPASAAKRTAAATSSVVSASTTASGRWILGPLGVVVRVAVAVAPGRR